MWVVSNTHILARGIQREPDVLPLIRRMAFLPYATVLDDLQTPLKDGARLIVEDQLRSKLLQRALGERTRFQFNPQRHLPPQVIVGAWFGYFIRDVVVGL